MDLVFASEEDLMDAAAGEEGDGGSEAGDSFPDDAAEGVGESGDVDSLRDRFGCAFKAGDEIDGSFIEDN